MCIDNQENTSEKPLHNKYDKGYKFLLSSKRVFLELVKSFINQEWVEQIDENKIEKMDKSFILPDFDEKEADIIYKLKIENKEVIFYILLELQSTVDFQMPYRLLLYMVEIWRSILKDLPKTETERKDFRLPAIIPIVLYNGENNWTVSMNFRKILNGYEIFKQHVLDFEYILIDVNRYSEEELMGLSNLIGAVFLIDQKADIEKLKQRLQKLIDVLKKLSPEEFLLFKTWLKRVIVRGLPEKEKRGLSEVIEESEEVDEMIYNLERALQEEFQKREIIGMEKGMEKGMLEAKLEIARKLINKGRKVDEIIEITGLSEEEILKLQVN
ncbi:MAG: hypothetical protein PWQ60_554 [Thermoanaerobacteraceae bacterium]|uniref:Rpn family recombination-promoting nuclease/putative transposase n=1 Tax=Biomaibacter acetigenes TaxID=2316383 RepID=UPI001CA395FC|nr:Rpn family recombination-promoting nuclease/putative transposase [Biomaibacter acetigenes]MDN5301040.1 hypothetical protein [Thermoanaerobacteraceae bacterium]MDN5312044.1 hypothetical protein [Thermoanaerobacteraceae bacterium]